MNSKRMVPALLIWIAAIFAVSGSLPAGEAAAETPQKQLIIDEAGLLNEEEIRELNRLANEYGARRETDILIYTTLNPENEDVLKMTQNYYDTHAPGYDKPHGNTVMLTLDMRNRELYLAGFYKAETYLDDERLDLIRMKITPDLSAGNYYEAFRTYVLTSYKYLGIRPGVNPENPLFQTWFQLAVSLGIAGGIVGIMLYHSGGRVTVNRQTYEDPHRSWVVTKRDRYLYTTTTKTKMVDHHNSGGSSGGGGGITPGGHSHSGSRGSF